ncbi:MAG: hypothetical protein HY043_19245 [Verrucomicrobia bacterium]|nr:hypothetical protein [Verrucomicrobiota bacterium]
MEDFVYLCSWKADNHGFIVWLKEHPHSKAAGRTIGEAVEWLTEAVRADGGAITPTFEFTPPLPANGGDYQFRNPDLVTVIGDERFETNQPRVQAFASETERRAAAEWNNQFFTGNTCSKCQIPSGPRNDRLLELTHMRAGYDGGFVSVGAGIRCVFSEEFLNLLTEQERQFLELRPVAAIRRGRKRFFELVGLPRVSFVGVSCLESSGWECPKCKGQCFGYFVKGLPFRNFVACADLPSALPSVFTVGSYWNTELCITTHRWNSLVGKKGTRGLVSHPLGAVPEDYVARSLKLKLLE